MISCPSASGPSPLQAQPLLYSTDSDTSRLTNDLACTRMTLSGCLKALAPRLGRSIPLSAVREASSPP
jgi:hypothetical protein